MIDKPASAAHALGMCDVYPFAHKLNGPGHKCKHWKLIPVSTKPTWEDRRLACWQDSLICEHASKVGQVDLMQEVFYQGFSYARFYLRPDELVTAPGAERAMSAFMRHSGNWKCA